MQRNTSHHIASAFGNAEFLHEEERPRHHLLEFFEQVHLAASSDISIHTCFSAEVIYTTIFPRENLQMHACTTWSPGQADYRAVRVYHYSMIF